MSGIGPGRSSVLTSPASSFLRLWSAVTGLAAGLVSSADALLLQRSRSYFTGGFLAVDYLEGAAQTVLFLALSVLLDAAVVGALAFAAMWLAARWRLRRPAVVAAGITLGSGPLLLADVASYQLMRYLGVNFDLGLMFDLTGRSVAEMLAVSAPQVIALVAVVVALVLGAGVCIWAINRRSGTPVPAPPLRTVVVPFAVLLIASAALTFGVPASAAIENGVLRKPSGQLLAAAIDGITDTDRDGFGAIGRLADPDPRNANVFPFAIDVPGNGIDENGIAGDLPANADKYPELDVRQDGWERSPDVVLVLLEGFRADLVGARYQQHPITPVIDALIARGALSVRAYSHNGYTVQSRFHVLAGSMVARTGAPTLVDDFKANGYRVGYFSGQDEGFGAAAYRVGFDRADVAYDARADVERRYSTFTTAGSLAVPYRLVQDRVEQFVKERQHDASPLFVYVNFEDTHFPYAHDGVADLVSPVRVPRDEISRATRDALWATYANTAANIDRAIGQLIENVRSVRGREPAIIITSDHGESLFDEGFLGHGYALNDVQTQVPLIVANLPVSLYEPFGQVDLRHAVTAALRRPGTADSAPVISTDGRDVFQYLGELRRPRQIGLLRGARRFVYDFRTGRVSTWDGALRRVSELGSEDRDTFVRLIHYWEWMTQARRPAPAAR